jgi:catechol 2,3-dioxygenase-like lactoylglutathione lyase family enzyme
MTVALSHVTIAVSDLVRSERFYSKALGFSRLYAAEPDDAFKRLLERTESRSLAMVAMQAGDFRIELLKIEPTDGGLSAPPSLGLRHLAVRVDDLQAAAAAVTRAGGRVLPDSEVSPPAGRFMMCADPDGLRLLLMEPAPNPS